MTLEDAESSAGILGMGYVEKSPLRHRLPHGYVRPYPRFAELICEYQRQSDKGKGDILPPLTPKTNNLSHSLLDQPYNPNTVLPQEAPPIGPGVSGYHKPHTSRRFPL